MIESLVIYRVQADRSAMPSARVDDSQPVKVPAAKERGHDVFKTTKGRKRQITEDTDGRLLAVNLTPADEAESTDVLQSYG